MSATTSYEPRNPRSFNRLLKWTYGAWLRRTYRIEEKGLGIFEAIKAPYVIVGNHVSTRDVLFVSSLAPDPVYWVGTDAHLRTRVKRFILGLVGTIPKSKAIPDIATINIIVKVIRKRGGVVGLYPEGEQTWDGRTLPLYHSTAKLLKLLKVPVVNAMIRGANASLPRWAWNRRPGRVEVEFTRLFSPAELKTLGVDEIEGALAAALRHDELDWIDERGFSYRSSRRAEHLELALFMCPRCSTVGRMRSRGSLLVCDGCGAGQRLDGRYRFRPVAGLEPRFPDPRAWYAWQAGAFGELLAAARVSGGAEPIFSDEGARLKRGHRMNPLRLLSRGRLLLYADRLELAAESGARLLFHLADLSGVGVLTRQILEFYVGRHLYQIDFSERHVSARKWQMAVEALEPSAKAAAAAEA
jgi:1-acyl-sn-glycerol-3-phosphate acyltransferase